MEWYSGYYSQAIYSTCMDFKLLLFVCCIKTRPETLSAAVVAGATRAQRICRPPPAASNVTGKVMLVIGDSVSLGYTPLVGALLNRTGIVLHAPFSGDGGACDTAYALNCLPLWLNASLGGGFGTAPKYDAIVFNFGLHDTNDSDMDEESRDEFVPLEQ